MHEDARSDRELSSKKAESLASLEFLESAYKDFCSCRDAFWAQKGEFPLGYPAHILAALLEDLAAFDLRFGNFTSAAQQLEAANRPEPRRRLSEIQADCKRTISLLQDMHEDRLASEREAAGIVAKSPQGVLDTLGSVSRSLRHVLGMDGAAK